MKKKLGILLFAFIVAIGFSGVVTAAPNNPGPNHGQIGTHPGGNIGGHVGTHPGGNPGKIHKFNKWNKWHKFHKWHKWNKWHKWHKHCCHCCR